MEFDTTELAVCTPCLFVIAYGEYDDGTDAAEKSAAGISATWGDDAMHLIAGGGDLGHSTSACDACGDWMHGTRHAAIALIPKGK
jgi:hypothetical protein